MAGYRCGRTSTDALLRVRWPRSFVLLRVPAAASGCPAEREQRGCYRRCRCDASGVRHRVDGTRRGSGRCRLARSELFKAIKQTAQLFIVVILAVRDQSGAVIEQGKKERVHRSIPYAQGGTVHHIGHPQRVGQLGLEGLGRAAALSDEPGPIQPFAH